MITCTGGRIEAKDKAKQSWWYLRLYFKDDTKTGNKAYSSQYYPTGLLANRKNRSEAEKMLAEKRDSYSPIGANTKFSTYCKNWLEKKRKTTEITTFEGYQYKLSHVIRYFDEKSITLSELSPEMVQDFYYSLLEIKKKAPMQHNDTGLSNRTIKDIAVLLRSIVDDAVILGHFRDDKAAERIKRVKAPQVPQKKEKRPYISISKLPVFLEAIKGKKTEYAFTIALYYGLRREEIAGLKWSAIRNGRIYIENTVTRMKTLVEKDRTKTEASQRDYVLLPVIKTMFAEIKEQQERNRKLLGNDYFDSDYVFTHENGNPFSPDYLTKAFHKMIKAHKELDQNLHLHDLRASCVSIFINAGLSPKAVQGWTGHEDFQTMFGRYARSDEEEEMRLANYMSDAIFGG